MTYKQFIIATLMVASSVLGLIGQCSAIQVRNHQRAQRQECLEVGTAQAVCERLFPVYP